MAGRWCVLNQPIGRRRRDLRPGLLAPGRRSKPQKLSLCSSYALKILLFALLFRLFPRDMTFFSQQRKESVLSFAQVLQALLGQIHIPARGPKGESGDYKSCGADHGKRTDTEEK
ncbi:MAG TPA: hypothetical protein VFJ72_11770 [Rubrobacteraceae bacterium]|nr:hypothetical protein [Rubrobacteraceae bacterium]